MSLREVSRDDASRNGVSETLGMFLAVVGVIFLLVVIVMLLPMFPQFKEIFG